MIESEALQFYPITLDGLPPRWVTTTVAEACKVVEPGFACGRHRSDGIGVPHLRPMNVSRSGQLDLSEIKYVDPSVDARRLRPGDILFNNTNSPALIGKTCFVPRDSELAFSNHMTRLTPKEGVDGRFLAHQLHFLWMSGYFLHKCVKHVNQASVSSQALSKAVPVVLPPIGEQIQIVAALDSYFSRLDEVEAGLERVQRNLRRYRASVLQAAVTGRLVPTEAELARAEGREYEPACELLKRILVERRKKWEESGRRGKYEEPAPPDTSNLPELPEGWCWADFGSLWANVTDSKRKLARRDYRPTGAFPAIDQGEDFIGGFSDEPGLVHRASLPVIVFGDHTRCVKYVDRPFIQGADGVRVLTPSRLLVAKFSYWLLRATNIPSRGYSRHYGILEKLVFPLPPAPEQYRITNEIERQISVLDEMHTQLQSSWARFPRFRQSILKRAFEGKLVDQIPYGGPGEYTLKSIPGVRVVAAEEGAMPRHRGRRSR